MMDFKSKVYQQFIIQIHDAIKRGELKKLKEMLKPFSKKEKRKIINNNEIYNLYYSTALHSAIRHYHNDCECNDNWDKCDKKHEVPNKEEIVIFLLQSGADVTIVDYYKNTPYDHCISDHIYWSDPAPELAKYVKIQI